MVFVSKKMRCVEGDGLPFRALSALSLLSVVLLFGVVLFLGGCGKRAAMVEAPEGGASEERIYPDVSLDPAPKAEVF